MQTLIGRLTANAKVSTLKDDRQVVNFSIAMNDQYKPKNGEPVKMTTYVNCSYWVSSKIAEFLTKGTLVELTGRISVSAYTNSKGEAKASLDFHVNNITLHGKSSKVDPKEIPSPAEITEPIDDLPF